MNVTCEEFHKSLFTMLFIRIYHTIIHLFEVHNVICIISNVCECGCVCSCKCNCNLLVIFLWCSAWIFYSCRLFVLFLSKLFRIKIFCVELSFYPSLEFVFYNKAAKQRNKIPLLLTESSLESVRSGTRGNMLVANITCGQLTTARLDETKIWSSQQ